MKVYDRYGASPAHAQSERRAAFIKVCLKPAGYVLLWLVFLAAAHMAGAQAAELNILVWGTLIVLILTAEECIRPLRENDPFTFGYDGRNFAVLGISGKPRRIVPPEALARIRIAEACIPFRRSKRTLRFFGRARRVYIYEPYGGRKCIRGKKRFVAEAMALLEPAACKRKEHAKWTEGVFFDTTAEFLEDNVGFVLRGENRKLFVHLLENTRCPVVIRREFYDLHRRQLDALFRTSGMDPKRLEIETE